MKQFVLEGLTKLGGLGIAAFTRHLMATLDYQAVLYDESMDPSSPDFIGPNIYCFWHEYITVPFYLRGHCDIAMLVSRHQDAEWLSQAARHMGFQTVRGSTNRGGTRALREMLRASRSLNLAITPDGPRGPRRKLAPGPVYLASRLELPLVLMGIGIERPWVLPTWDRFKVPRPYSRVRGIMSPGIRIPSDLDRDGIEEQRQRIELRLNQLTLEAEQWAASGERLANQRPIVRGGRSLIWRRLDRAAKPLLPPPPPHIFRADEVAEDEELRAS